MNDGEMIMTSVLDVWCCFLNSLENLKATTSPRRLFCYSETTVSLIFILKILCKLTFLSNLFSLLSWER